MTDDFHARAMFAFRQAVSESCGGWFLRHVSRREGVIRPLLDAVSRDRIAATPSAKGDDE